MSKTKSAKRLSVPTHVYSTIDNPTQLKRENLERQKIEENNSLKLKVGIFRKTKKTHLTRIFISILIST